ncbi:MAG: hypothetical protein ABIT69_02715 [Sphingomicrobium sp.]
MLIDVGIVVLGVFLGTQVSNWNQARIESAKAEEYRARLASELDFDARQYGLQAAYYRQAQNYGLKALADLDGTRRLSDSDFLIAAYQLTQIDTTHAKTGVYAEMAAAGLTDRLGDYETQQLASDFYLTAEVAQRMIETTLPYRTLLREVMPYAIQTAVRDRCGDRNVFYNGRLVGITLVIPCPLKIDPTPAAQAARTLRAVPGLERQMTRYIASIDEKTFNLELAGRQARSFRTRLLALPGPPAA